MKNKNHRQEVRLGKSAFSASLVTKIRTLHVQALLKYSTSLSTALFFIFNQCILLGISFHLGNRK